VRTSADSPPAAESSLPLAIDWHKTIHSTQSDPDYQACVDRDKNLQLISSETPGNGRIGYCPNFFPQNSQSRAADLEG
jgi:hypothetical protein